LGIKHKIEDSGAHQQLVQDLARMHDRFLCQSVLPGASMTVRGLTSWKISRRKLSALSAKLEAIEKQLFNMSHDQVVLGAIRKVDEGWRTFDSLVAALVELTRLIRKAAEIEGKKGNRKLPAWADDAARMCRDFWRENMDEEPSGYFKREHNLSQNAATLPGNEFSAWFCDVMKAVCHYTPSQCETILGRK
jgi:hypothetical protein